MVKEGYYFGLPPLVASGAAFQLHWYLSAAVLVFLALFVFSFFRDPDRVIPAESGAVVSPADGRVVVVTEEENAGRPGQRLLGHLHRMLTASQAAARLFAASVPLLPGAAELAASGFISGGTRANTERMRGFAQVVEDGRFRHREGTAGGQRAMRGTARALAVAGMVVEHYQIR